MGNSQSQQPSKSLCLLQLIRRSWRVVSSVNGSRRKCTDDADDCATDFSTASRCSGCKGCGYHQELHFDSDSDMAPNAEEDLLVSMPRGPHSAKERLRPPTYNAEDYAIALRRWGRRALGGQPDNGQGTLPSSCTSSSSGYASGNPGEMTLRQFTSVSELLNKLRADLRLAFPSFVQEFASPPAEGISLLLETLRGVQLSQTSPPSGQTGPRRPRGRRAALDELGCVECLAACAERCPEATRALAQAQPGLLALAACLTSSLNRSRVLALQLLTRVCQTSGGHGAVSEAVSTLRLRYAEGGRFRFLAGALLASKAALALRVAGVSFLNAFLASAPRAQTKLYIQAEACEAGLEPRALQEWLKQADEEDPMMEHLRDEVRKWSRHCVDVDALQGRARRAEETCRVLTKKVSALQNQLYKIQLERLNEYNRGKPNQLVDEARENSRLEIEKKVSSSAEDEGISFSERSSSPEDQPTRSNNNAIDNDQETTIDDVIEELRIIVKDAEEELHDWTQLQENCPKVQKSEFGKPPSQPPKNKSIQPSKARECLRNTEENARLDRGLKTCGSLKIVVPAPQHFNRDTNEEDDVESAIVPAIIHPQPPKRAPPCIITNFPSHPEVELIIDDEDEEDEDGSDSLLSASRLNYPGKLDLKIESLADFEISETDERIPRKRLDTNNSLGSRAYSKCTNTVQRRTERKKYLRRCQSQDHLDPHQESSRGVIEHIRKFESLNSFDDRRSLPNFDESSSRLRRSESFHQTRRDEVHDTGNSMTKSLDRIDEGLDSMVNVIVKKERRQLSRRLSSERQDLWSGHEDDRKYTSFLDTKREYHQNDSRIFAGRQHDVLGLGRNRFNAGKYSGNNHHQQFLPKNFHRHVTSSHHARGKVTDIVSGLY